MSSKDTVQVKSEQNAARLLHEEVPDDKSLIIKLEYSPDSPVTSDCKNLSHVQKLENDTDEDECDIPLAERDFDVEYLDIPYASRADMILNMGPMTDDEIEMYGDLYDSKLMDDTTEYDWCHTLGNNNCLYQWFWRSLSDPPNPITKKKITFSGTAGPTEKFSLYKAFTSIWDKTVIDDIVCETNKNASNTVSTWTDVTQDELYVFLAITLATMGLDDISQYWQTENVDEAMSYHRFTYFNDLIRFSDTSSGIDMSESQTIVANIKPMITKLNKNFRSLYTIGQDVVFDDPYEVYKSKDNECKFLKKTQNIKEVHICDAKTGYVRTVLISAAKKDSYLPPKGISPLVILKFMEINKDKGYTIWSDNIYNSALLARTAFLLNCNFVGTLRMNEEIGSEYDDRKKKLKIGEVSGGSDNDVDYILWRREENIVSLVSTYHGGGTNEDMGRLVPVAFVDLKNIVSSLDERDTILADYVQVGRKDWVCRLFDRLLNISVYNSLILSNCSEITSEIYRDFRQILVQDLISRHSIDVKPVI